MERKEKVRKMIYRILACLLTVVLAGFLLLRLTYVTREKTYSWMHDEFNRLRRGKADTFFVGNSHSFCSISTDLLWGEYGINSFMMSTSGQTLAMDYYAIQEIEKYQDCKTVYLEMSYAIHDWNTINDEMSHMFFDGMKFGSIKREAVKELIEKDSRIYYYLPLGQFHSRATTLTQTDYVRNDSPYGSFYSEVIFNSWPITVVDKDIKAPMTENSVYYLDKIVDFCREHDIELVLWTAPYNAMYETEYDEGVLRESQAVYNGIEDYAAEKGLKYYNLFHDVEKIGFNYALDFMDSQHLNCNGQSKLTTYMVENGYIE